jgi:cobalt-zinc-cadmium efflux system outer membrane protein
MRTPVKPFALAVPLMLAASAGYAQSAIPQSQLSELYFDAENGLSLNDAVRRALEGEPSFRAVRAGLDVARGLRLQAGLRPNPTLSFERREEPAGSDNQTIVSVEWPLDLFRRRARAAVAEREVDAIEHSVADRALVLVADVRMRYGNAAAAVRDVGIADNVAASARRQLDLLRGRVDEGASPPLERDLLDVEVRRLESDRLLAVARADVAMFELRRAVGLAADAPLRLRDPLERLVGVDDAGSGVADAGGTAVPSLDAPAVRQRPDVREAETQVQLAQARLDNARAAARFDVSVFGSYMRMDAGFPQRGINASGDLTRVRGVFHYLAGGAMVMVPLLNRNQGGVAAASAERAGAAATLEAAQLNAQEEMASAAARDHQMRAAAKLYEGGVRLARQNLDVVRQTYELGRLTVSDVLTEQRRYLDMERAYTDTLRQAFEARTALRRARGEQ